MRDSEKEKHCQTWRENCYAVNVNEKVSQALMGTVKSYAQECLQTLAENEVSRQ